jgi:hypothetical protein
MWAVCVCVRVCVCVCTHVQHGARVARVEDGREPHALGQRLHHQRVQLLYGVVWCGVSGPRGGGVCTGHVGRETHAANDRVSMRACTVRMCRSGCEWHTPGVCTHGTHVIDDLPCPLKVQRKDGLSRTPTSRHTPHTRAHCQARKGGHTWTGDGHTHLVEAVSLVLVWGRTQPHKASTHTA